jgi:hypothetical protein
MMRDMAQNNLPKAKSSAGTAKSGVTQERSIGEIFVDLIMGVNHDRRALGNEIKDMVFDLLKDARANITVIKGVDYEHFDQPDYFYMIVNNYQIVDVGKGVLKNANVNVTVDSDETAMLALRNTDALTTYYSAGKIKFSGTGGVVEGINVKMMGWISKYFNFR